MAVGSDPRPLCNSSRPPKGKCQVQRNYFARSPGSDMWVHFDDLPEATRKILSEKAAQDILSLGKVASTKHQA